MGRSPSLPAPAPRPQSPATGEVEVTLTGAEAVAASHRDEEIANVRLGHAIAFLTNHVFAFGARGETDVSSQDVFHEGTPAEVRRALTGAIVAAARHVGRSFAGPDDAG